MKRCNTCGQQFSDEYDFCLNDGTPLGGVTSDPTVVLPNAQIVSEPTVVLQPPRITSNTANAEPRRSNTALFMMFGIILVLAVAAAGFAVAFFMNQRGDDKQVAVNQPSNTQKGSDDQNRLKEQLEQVNADSQKLAEEKRKLESEKQKLEKQKQITGPPPSGSSAMIIDPPTNIRQTPNGAILCVIKSRTVVTILNSPSIPDKNGVWYRTTACGSTGLVHSSQISFSY